MTKEFVFPIQVSEDDISCLLANARSDTCGCQWWDYDDAEFEAAEAELEKEGSKDPCLEEVWARMLFKGQKLNLLDPESDWHWHGHEPGEMLWSFQIAAENSYPEGGEWHEVGLEDIVEGVRKYGAARIANDCGADLQKINEEGDFWDADAVIQFAMYGDCIYG